MTPDDDDLLLIYRHAFRRSRLRVEIMLALLEFGRQSLTDLARLAGGTAENVYGALLGFEKRYRHDGALVLLGLVQMRMLRGEETFELTDLGVRVARALRAQVTKRRGEFELIRT